MTQRTKKFLETMGFVAILTAMVMVMLWGGYNLYLSTRWDPLGDYPIQVVNPTAESESQELGPPITTVESDDNSISSTVSFYLDQDIYTSGLKCVKDSEGTLMINGVLTWVSERPPGRILKVAKGTGERGPGCQFYNFANPVPPEVLAEVEKLSARGITTSDWHLTGTETPFKVNGEEGVPRTWKTTTFTLIHENAPQT